MPLQGAAQGAAEPRSDILQRHPAAAPAPAGHQHLEAALLTAAPAVRVACALWSWPAGAAAGCLQSWLAGAAAGCGCRVLLPKGCLHLRNLGAATGYCCHSSSSVCAMKLGCWCRCKGWLRDVYGSVGVGP